MFVIPSGYENNSEYSVGKDATQSHKYAIQLLDMSNLPKNKIVWVYSKKKDSYFELKNIGNKFEAISSQKSPGYVGSSNLLFIMGHPFFNSVYSLNAQFGATSKIDSIIQMIMMPVHIVDGIKSSSGIIKDSPLETQINEFRKKLMFQANGLEDVKLDSIFDVYYFIYGGFFRLFFENMTFKMPINEEIMYHIFLALKRHDQNCATVFFCLLPKIIDTSKIRRELHLVHAMMNSYSNKQSYIKEFIRYVSINYPPTRDLTPELLRIIRFLHANDLVHQFLFETQDQCYHENMSACDLCTQDKIINNRFYLPQYQCHAICSKQRCSRTSVPGFDFCRLHAVRESLADRSRSEAVRNHTFIKTELSDVNSKKATIDEYDLNSEDGPVDKFVHRHKGSKRPINNLGDIKGTNDTIPPGTYLPVYRIEQLYHKPDTVPSQEISNGIVISNLNGSYCGKFFFYERTSQHVLRLGKYHVFATKVDAFVKLLRLAGDKCLLDKLDLNAIIGVVPANDITSKKRSDIQKLIEEVYISNSRNLISSLPLNTTDAQMCLFRVLTSFYPLFAVNKNGRPIRRSMFRDTNIFDYFHSVILERNDALDTQVNQNLHIFYPTILSGINSHAVQIGQLDDLDQPICKMGRFLGLDTIILQHEIGSKSCVSELLWCGHQNSITVTLPRDIRSPSKKRKHIDHTDIFNKVWFPFSDNTFHVDEEKNFKAIELDELTNLNEPMN